MELTRGRALDDRTYNFVVFSGGNSSADQFNFRSLSPAPPPGMTVAALAALSEDIGRLRCVVRVGR